MERLETSLRGVATSFLAVKATSLDLLCFKSQEVRWKALEGQVFLSGSH